MKSLIIMDVGTGVAGRPYNRLQCICFATPDFEGYSGASVGRFRGFNPTVKKVRGYG